MEILLEIVRKLREGWIYSTFTVKDMKLLKTVLILMLKGNGHAQINKDNTRSLHKVLTQFNFREGLGTFSWRGRFTWKWRGCVNKAFTLLVKVSVYFCHKNGHFTTMEREEVIISNGDGLQSTQTLFDRVMAVCYIETIIKDQRSRKERLKWAHCLSVNLISFVSDLVLTLYKICSTLICSYHICVCCRF